MIEALFYGERPNAYGSSPINDTIISMMTKTTMNQIVRHIPILLPKLSPIVMVLPLMELQ